MEANDSEPRSSSSTDDSTFKRHSNRIKKPSNLFEPQPVHSKRKNSKLNVNCEILKTKGISIRSKQLDFPLQANMQAHKVVENYLKKIKFQTSGCTVVYFCEETQSIYYLEWKKFKRTDQFVLGNTYKIRVVKLKKPEKVAKPKIVEKKKVEKKIEKKVVDLNEAQNLMPKMNENDFLQYMMYIQNCVYKDYSMLMRMALFQNFS